MGPRSADRGIKDSPSTSTPSTRLQWGRDQLIAELLIREPRVQRLLMLQWGRDQLIAELAAVPTILLSMICDTASERLWLGPLYLNSHRILS